MKIGFIGLGRMGLPMAMHAIKAKHEVSGYDIDGHKSQALAAVGGKKALSAIEVVENSEIVITLIGNDKLVRDVVLGNNLLKNMKQGSILVLSDTLWFQTPEEIQQKAVEFGVEVLDAPLCRPESAAQKGDILSLIGGKEEVYKRCLPVLKCYSSDIFHVGGLGAGQIAKSINNYILWACSVANDEALKVAKKQGVNIDALVEALLHSSASNWALGHIEEVTNPPWAKKDMQLFMQMVDHVDEVAPFAALVKEYKK